MSQDSLPHQSSNLQTHKLTRRQLLKEGVVRWLWRLPVIAVVAGVFWGAQKAYRVHFLKEEPSRKPSFEATEPVKVGAVAAFANLWDTQAFTLAGTPALAVRVPEPQESGVSVGGVHLVAFSRLCTHQGCVTQLSTNTEAIAVAYNYRTSHPAVVCPCHFSAFDVLKGGKAVSGPALKPLRRVQLEHTPPTLVATGLEKVR